MNLDNLAHWSRCAARCIGRGRLEALRRLRLELTSALVEVQEQERRTLERIRGR